MHDPKQLAELVRRNLQVVQSFASNEDGDISEVEADRALHEMAAQLRLLDNALGIGRDLQKSGYPALGYVVLNDGTREDLHFRDVTNKIMHAGRYEWAVRDGIAVVTCIAKKDDRWQSAETSVDRLAALCDRILP